MGDGKPTGSAFRLERIVAVTVAVTLLAFYLYYPHSPAGRQAKNMAIAKEHLPKVEPLIRADPRFANVTADVYTDNDGSLGMFGWVRTEEDLAELKRLVQSTSPPVRVSWLVRVPPPELLDDAVKPTTRSN